MSTERIAEIRERLENITPEPWFARNILSQGYTILWREPQNGEMLAPICHMRWIDGLHPDVTDRVANECEFIAAARSDIPWLLSLIDDLQAELDRLATENIEYTTRIGELQAENERLRRMVPGQTCSHPQCSKPPTGTFFCTRVHGRKLTRARLPRCDDHPVRHLASTYEALTGEHK